LPRFFLDNPTTRLVYYPTEGGTDGMKTSLKDLPAVKRPPAVPVAPPQAEPPAYRTAQTRVNTRQLSGHFPAEAVQAWRILAAEQDMDSQELLAEAMNMIFERFGKPTRVEITSGRRKKVVFRR
jgi:hypothetical protein